MLRGAVPNNSRVVLATAARVEIVFWRSLSGEGRSSEGEGGAVGWTRQEVVRRGETWGKSQEAGTLRVKNTHTKHNTSQPLNLSVLHRARGSGEGPCQIQRHRQSRAL